MPDPPWEDLGQQRPWIEEAGGVWAADSPKLMFDMLETVRALGATGT